jgi:hypothetical protein
MTCQTLVHKLGCDQPKTTKELLDIAIHYPSGEEVIGVVFILGDGKTVLDAGRGGAPSKATGKGAKGSVEVWYHGYPTRWTWRRGQGSLP